MPTPPNVMDHAHPNGQYKRQCPYCESVFLTDDKRVKYCSTRCRSNAARLRYHAKYGYAAPSDESRHDPKGKYPKNCKHCGEYFRTNNKNVKYCSQKCHKAFHMASWHRRNRTGLKKVHTKKLQRILDAFLDGTL